eukprot:6245794-Amphidinium_carterae.1
MHVEMCTAEMLLLLASLPRAGAVTDGEAGGNRVVSCPVNARQAHECSRSRRGHSRRRAQRAVSTSSSPSASRPIMLDS